MSLLTRLLRTLSPLAGTVQWREKGLSHLRQGDRSEALAALLRASERKPHDRKLSLLVAELLLKSGQALEARERLERLAADRADAMAGYLLGLAYRDLGDADEATRHLERLVERHGQHAPALEVLAMLYRDAARIEEAVALYARLEALRPDLASAGSARLFHQLYRDHDRQALFRQHIAWGRRFAASRQRVAFSNAPLPERSLSVGYVSADLNASSAAPFIEPLLVARDGSAFRVICYSTSKRVDAMTARLRSYADAWRDIDGVSDERAAAQVREDGVDILVDLNGHTRGGRLPLFAARAAPVQVTYLGYGATTGVDAIDYRITDAWIDPPGSADQYYTERLVRLPGSMWCFLARTSPRPPGPLPASANGFVTFASLNNFSKVTPRALGLWARILNALPDARLVLAGVREGEPRRRVEATLAKAGVAAARLAFRARTDYAGFLRLLGEVDIALDTFPYTGGATTCEALSLGVPTVTLAGETVLARSGLSILQAAGMGQWIARHEDDYLQIAIARATDRPQLAALRAELPSRVAASPLCDAAGFARAIEAQYRWMWQQWCLNKR